MIAGSLARRYAKALLSIALEDGSQEEMVRQLEELSRTYAHSPELQQALVDPVFRLSERRTLLEAVCARLAITRMLRNLAMLLLDRGRVVALPAISRELGVLVDAHANRVRARVTSARPLAPEVEAKLRTQLEARLGKRVVLERREDPGLIGGLTTEVGDLFFDGSLRYHMETLRKQLEEA